MDDASMNAGSSVDEAFYRYLGLLESGVRDFSVQERHDVCSLRSSLGESLLHYVAIEDRADLVHFLSGLGASVDNVNLMGKTPLMDVALMGNSGMLVTLLKLGANAFLKEESTGCTALHWAVFASSPDAFRVLFSVPGLRSVRDASGFTAVELIDTIKRANQLGRGWSGEEDWT